MTFCETAQRYLEWNYDQTLIVRGVVGKEIVVNEYRTDRIFKISESFHNPRGLSEVRIREGNGADCGRSLTDYGKGDELIIAISIWEDSLDIGQFSICDPAPLRVKNGKVSGMITEQGDQQLSLGQFRSLGTCGHTGTLGISLFPNPAHEQVTLAITTSGRDLSALQKVEIRDVSGRLLYRYPLSKEEKTRPNLVISTEDWPSGFYFASLYQNEQSGIIPIVITH